jgi:hypothetical protein
MLQREIIAAKTQSGIEYSSEGAITKAPFRCLACDRLLWKATSPNTSPGTPYMLDNFRYLSPTHTKC